MPQSQGREPGVYLNLSMQDYHEDSAIGSSGIKKLIISPEEFWFNSSLNPDREQEKPTAAMRFGTMYHQMVLEPEKPFEWQIKEKVESTSVEGMVGRGDYDTMVNMYARLLRSPKAWNSLHGGINEVSIFWRDENSQLMMKMRPDCFAPEWVSDLKTCADVSDKALYFDFTKYGYDISGAHYSNGMQALKQMIRDGYKMPPEFDENFVKRFMAREKQMFCFVFQSKSAPYSVRLWAMSPYASEEGLSKIAKGIGAYHENMHNPGPWPSGWPDVEEISEGMIYINNKM